MLELDWRVHEAADATLVAAVVESAAPTARRVRIKSRLDGPVWPPRRRGVPERGWDGDVFEGVVQARGRLPFGFATPADPDEPPVELVDHERTDPPESTSGATGVEIPAQTPSGIVRALGSPAPSGDAVPLDAACDGGHPSATSTESGRTTEGDEGPVGKDHEREPTDEEAAAATASGGDDAGDLADSVDEQPPADSPELPDAVSEWLDAVAVRIDLAAALADAPRAAAAARAVERAGGLDGVEALAETLAADERALRAVAERADALAQRRQDVAIPLSALRDRT